jgi:hypothetical protein
VVLIYSQGCKPWCREGIVVKRKHRGLKKEPAKVTEKEQERTVRGER